jgi:hypothetical protein
MSKIKTVNWNVEKFESIRVNIIGKNGYKTQILLDKGLTNKINAFYFSDEMCVTDCMSDEKTVKVEKIKKVE